MKYINTKTGFILETDCIIEGEFWEKYIEPKTETETVKPAKKTRKK